MSEKNGNSRWSVITCDGHPGEVGFLYEGEQWVALAITRDEWLQLRAEADEAFGVGSWENGFKPEDAPKGIEVLVGLEECECLCIMKPGGIAWAAREGDIVRWWPLPKVKE